MRQHWVAFVLRVHAERGSPHGREFSPPFELFATVVDVRDLRASRTEHQREGESGGNLAPDGIA